MECDSALHCRDDNGGPVRLWMEGDRLSLTLTLVDTAIFFSSLAKTKSHRDGLYSCDAAIPKNTPSFRGIKCRGPLCFNFFLWLAAFYAGGWHPPTLDSRYVLSEAVGLIWTTASAAGRVKGFYTHTRVRAGENVA